MKLIIKSFLPMVCAVASFVLALIFRSTATLIVLGVIAMLNGQLLGLMNLIATYLEEENNDNNRV